MRKYTIQIFRHKKADNAVNSPQQKAETPQAPENLGENLGQGEKELLKGPMKPMQAFNLFGEMATKESEFENFLFETLKDLGYSKNMAPQQKRALIAQAGDMMREKYKDLIDNFNL